MLIFQSYGMSYSIIIHDNTTVVLLLNLRYDLIEFINRKMTLPVTSNRRSSTFLNIVFVQVLKNVGSVRYLYPKCVSFSQACLAQEDLLE